MIEEYIHKTKKIYIPYVANKFGVSQEEVTNVIVESKIDGRIYEKMFVVEPPKSNWYVEVCDTKYDRGNYVKPQHNKRKDIKDQHQSVFLHDDDWARHADRTGKVSGVNSMVTSEYIYLELDRKTLDKAIEDAGKIYTNFMYRDAMQFYYSGNRSIHIGVDASLFGNPIGYYNAVCGVGKLFYNIAHKIAGDVRHENGLIDAWTTPKEDVFEWYEFTFGEEAKDLQQARQRLENLDPNLFRLNSLIRKPYSIHEKTGKQKIPVCPEHLLLGQLKETKEHDTKHPPYLLHWLEECYESKIAKPKPSTKIGANEEFIIRMFSKHIPGFDPADVNEHGFCGDYYSPFYEDGNPSVRVNIENGYYYDFGMPDHQFNFQQFLKEVTGHG